MELVVCCDGTWNTPDDLDQGLPAPTNVVKLRNILAERNADGAEQRAYYHPGVGTGGTWWDRIAGGGMGEGLEKNVQSAYHWLATTYRPGARIWLFGFSRGAFTVRSLSGMISQCGLLDLSDPAIPPEAVWKAVDAVYAAYRRKPTGQPKMHAKAEMRFHNVATGDPTALTTKIHFIGVWDTVGALGVPDDMALLNLIDDPTKYEFHDTDLSAAVVHARHAVALDERRQSFEPTLWTDKPPKQELKQVWFPGVHGDVGGGYSRCGLSDGALLWMVEEAKAQGLAFKDAGVRQIKPNAQDVLHDSLTGIFKTLKTRPRAAPLIDERSGDALHGSALERRSEPPITQHEYWPSIVLDPGVSKPVHIYARQHWNATGIYLERGATYEFAADGQWVDGSIPCGPGGTSDGSFHLGEAVRLASAVLGKLENAYKRFTANPQADFVYTKREEAFEWFALVGMVANGWKPEDQPKERPSQVFRIGSGTTFTPKASGYLYCFANDAWQTYDNNRGSVQLTVRRR
ncbi:DUF2235 domain-containing protein [Aureimonas leprariae]|uniref:DUF2235 domain-containing protein n=1 Tax=Plantimonas leprariae TaxID=2615207 RepID=A0A7V7TXC2_9HYPH|nr:DUF2235 domain-containing protein [Aureimonas leprariae]KAB0681354.1 DUF2235 domain-containing protein [Aureimonas leprariae]